jgi:OmpA-OmpF porin, OOP family
MRLCVAWLVLAGVSEEGARAEIPDDRAIDIQTFEYAIGPKSFFSVSDADVANQKQLAVDALVTYLTKPFKIYNVDETGMVGEERTTVVESLAAGQVTVAYGLSEKLQLGVNLPIVFALSGDGLDPNTGNASCAMPPCLKVTGLGDLLIEGKLRLYRKGKVRMAATAGLTLPTSVGSGGAEFIGDDLPAARGRFAVQLDPSTRFTIGFNAGVLLRKPRTIYDSVIGPQLTWGVGAAAKLTERFSLVGEGFGRAGVPDFSMDSSPLEALGGVRFYATGAVSVVFGGGAGLLRGIGSPEARVFLSIGYAPDTRDSDGDGIANGRDKCVGEPEDKDGWQDDDGCPEDDNDGDLRADGQDKCPSVAEDIDGFDDDDGCPELDNDKDGIADLQDKCPLEAEDGRAPSDKDGCPADKRDSDGDGVNDLADKCAEAEEDVDGFEDGDGCPETDNDKDGIPDATDACPVCPEDKDGFEDTDGCPDFDNDKDGVFDETDKCPNEPETINGVRDDDGCRDTGGATIARLDGDRLTVDRVPTLATATRLSPAGLLIVDQMALVMIANADVSKWLVAVGQPRAADAGTLAVAVKARLIARGVAESRLQVLGAAGPPKIGGLAQERGATAPACPAGREVKQRPEAAGAAPPPTPAAPAAPTPTAKPDPQPPEPKPDDIEME